MKYALLLVSLFGLLLFAANLSVNLSGTGVALSSVVYATIAIGPLLVARNLNIDN